MSSLEKVANSAYALLLVNYISQLEEPHRFLVLGFRDILKDLSIHFKRLCKGSLIIPTGKLEEISTLRKKLSPSLIALDWEDVGKYASWTTSFKILSENPLSMEARIPYAGPTHSDVHDPIDVINWLSKKPEAVEQILGFISKKLAVTTKHPRFDNLMCFLSQVQRSIQGSRSYAELFHPRKIIYALTAMLRRHKLHEDVTVGHFLRQIGMEPYSEFDEIPFFGHQTLDEKKLEKYVRKYQEILRSYLTAPYEKGRGKLRKSLSTLGLNLLRHLLTVAAEKELHEGKRGKWTNYFLEFEQGKIEKRTRRRKYDINSYGTTITERSLVSGLPTCIKFVLERSKGFAGDNILPTLLKNDLKALSSYCGAKINTLHFDISAVKMIRTDALLLELMMQESGLSTIDPYAKGLRAPLRKIYNLLSKLGVA